MNPEYTIYIPSKGRHDSRLTVKALEEMKVPYKIVIEKEEFNLYSKYIPSDSILVLPFSNQGLFNSRKWIMEYSISKGEEKHWQLDDNIYRFYRLNKNLKVPVSDGTIFRCAEDFTNRYNNIAVSGFQYFMFASRKSQMPPLYWNTRIYSISLINNSIPYRHRRLYNDDTDFCLLALKDGWCTILFNAFLAEKAQTMTVKGGNTESLYLIEDGRLKMTESLMADHPDCVTKTWKFGHWHHQVDYRRFKLNKPIKKNGLIIPNRVNNYGMELITI